MHGFAYALYYGPVPGHYEMIDCTLSLRTIHSIYKNYFKMTSDLSFVKPSLPVPRLGPDQAERNECTMIEEFYNFTAELHLLMSCKPGPGRGDEPKKDTHTLDFDVTLNFLE